MNLLYNYIPNKYAELCDKIFECNLLDLKYSMLQMLYDKTEKDKKIDEVTKNKIYGFYTGYFDSVGLIMDNDDSSYHDLTDTLVAIDDINNIDLTDALLTIDELFRYCGVQSIDYLKLYTTIDLTFEGFDRRLLLGKDLGLPSQDANLVIKLIGGMIQVNNKYCDTDEDRWINGLWNILCFAKNFIDIYETGARLGNDSLLNIFAINKMKELVDMFLQERTYPTVPIVSIIN